MKKIRLILFGVLFLAGILRFWQLDKTPPSMYWDEVSQGYNSYSILTTGKDEHNEFLPLARFQAFGDYKAPVYIYVDVPFLTIFGKTTFGVRAPSAFFGTLTVLVAFLLAFELFYSHKKRNDIALFTAFLLAISPWHIQLSRAAYEANIATFFTVLAIYLFFLSKRKNFWLMPFSIISLVIGFYAFNAHRIFIPLIGMTLVILYWKDLIKKERLKIVAFSLLVGFILMLPMLSYLKSPESKLRFNEVNIFSDSSIVVKSNNWIAEENNSPLAKILHNRRVLFAESYLKHYFDFFNPQYLFFTGDINPRFSSQDSGELYLLELPLLLIGIYTLARWKKKESIFIAIWFVLAPVAAATARETPHALRSETFIPTYELLIALGTVTLLSLATHLKKYIRRTIYVLFICFVGITFFIFQHNYYNHFPKIYSYDWQYGYKEAVTYAESVKNNYDTIAFTDTYGRPYIYVLFYGNVSPQAYWKEGKVTRDVFGFYNVSGIGKYEFRNQLIQESDKRKKVLYVGDPKQIPSTLHIKKTINFLDGTPDFVIASNI